MSKVLVVFQTFSGNTKRLAEALAEGAKAVKETEVTVRQAGDVTPEDVASADALAVGAPNTFGGMAGALRDFFDRMWAVHEQTEGKPAAVFTVENDGQTGAIEEIRKFFTFFKLNEVGNGLTTSAPVDANTGEYEKLGRALAEAIR